ncbi:MAG TPA: hypothetical protein VGW34_12245 [Allosphingosinicella sp.]|nr:hypothetical protein [Allosphingosinicella sp.]
MNKTFVAVALGGALLAFAPQAAAAQGMGPPTGAEITGHSVQAETNGVVNTIYFDAGGGVRIVSPAGREVQGTWTVENNRLCLATGAGALECWTYQSAFQPGQPVTLTSDCGTSRWTAVSTATMMPPEPPVRQGERG